jgi:hypothetical protein
VKGPKIETRAPSPTPGRLGILFLVFVAWSREGGGGFYLDLGFLCGFWGLMGGILRLSGWVDSVD